MSAYIVTIATSVASAMLVFVLQGQIRANSELKKKHEEQVEKKENALKNGVLCLLRNELMKMHTEYTTKKHISSKALENGLKMYEAYKSLGGNGMMDQLKEEISDLPVKN